MRRVPIKVLRKLCNEQKLDMAILFATDGKNDYIVTYGKSIVQSAQACQFGNILKDTLKWPASLHTEPKRLMALQNKIMRLEARLAEKW